MAKEDKLLAGLREHLEPGEEPVRGILGQYERQWMGKDSGVRAGIMVATDRRVVFYAKKLTGYDLESYPYTNISSLESGKNIMGRHIKFFASGNEVYLKWIKDADGLEKFVSYVRERMAGPSAAPTATAESAIDKLRKLGELKDAGVISDAEFEEKKAKLLGEI